MKPSSKNLEKKVKQIEKKLDNIEKTVEEKFTELWEEETKGMSETSKRLLREDILAHLEGKPGPRILALMRV